MRYRQVGGASFKFLGIIAEYFLNLGNLILEAGTIDQNSRPLNVSPQNHHNLWDYRPQEVLWHIRVLG